MGDFTVRSVAKGLYEATGTSLRRIWPALVLTVATLGGVSYNHYKSATDPTRIQRNEASRSSKPEPVSSLDGAFVAREEFKGRTRDIVLRETATGIETCIDLPASDEHTPAWIDGSHLQFWSDKDATFAGYGNMYDAYRIDVHDPTMLQRTTYNNPRPLLPTLSWAVAEGLGKAGVEAAGFFGLCFLAGWYVDRRRLRQGKKPYECLAHVRPALVYVFGTDEAKECLMSSALFPSAPLLLPTIEECRKPTQRLQQKSLLMLSALGDDFPANFLPVALPWFYVLGRKEFEKKVDREVADRLWHDLALIAYDATLYKFRRASQGIEHLITSYQDDKFVRLFAAEFYANVARVADTKTFNRRLMAGDDPGVDVSECNRRHVHHIEELVRLCGLSETGFTRVEGYKNEVFFSSMGELSGRLVFKRGDSGIHDEFDKLVALCNVNRYGVVPFPIAYVGPSDASSVFSALAREQHLLIERHVEGTRLRGEGWEELLGKQLASFQARSANVPHLGVYDHRTRCSDVIAPRLQAHIGFSLPTTYVDAIAGLGACPQTAVHGDFTVGNIKLHRHPVFGPLLSFLDVESVCRAPASEDIGCLLAHYATPEMDVKRLISSFSNAHDGIGRGAKDRMTEWSYLSGVHQWVRQVSTALEWHAKAKLSDAEFGIRRVAYKNRLGFLADAYFAADARSKHRRVLDVAEQIGAKL